MDEFLTIGSVVLLKGADHQLMIIGFYPQTGPDYGNKICEYIGCYFPEGFVDSTKPIVFNREDIDKVVYRAYSDDDDKKYRKMLLEIHDKVMEV